MDRTASGWINGFVGMLVFSGSLPATRVAVADLDPVFVTAVRAAAAAALGTALLLLTRQRPPARSDLASLAVVSLGVVVGFPLLTALALRHVTAAHALVFVGLLPMATAAFGVLRGGERPRPAFWGCALAGSLVVALYALRGSGAAVSLAGNALMLAAVVICGLGYAEGAILSRRLGGWQVISWALLLALPVSAPLALATMPSWPGVGPPALWALGYVSAFSMLIGFVFWYRGLAQGGIAAVGQLQLLQPFFGLALAAIVVRERIDGTMIVAALLVAACVFGAKRFAR